MRPTLDILLDHTCIFYHHRFLQALWGVGVGVGVGASYELLEECGTQAVKDYLVKQCRAKVGLFEARAVWCKCGRYVPLTLGRNPYEKWTFGPW